jgi:hypothetical protein
MFRSRLLSLILALSLGSSSCWLRKTKSTRVFVPPPAKPRPAIVAEVPELPQAPDIEVNYQPELPGDLFATMPAAGPPPAVAPRRPAAPPARVAAPSPAPVPEAPPPPPRLGQIFTAEQLREYNRNLDESLERVKKVLAAVVGKSLNPDLAEIISRIQTFQKQAEQARELDLVTAVNLARRADLLAQDLIKRLP